MQNTPYYWEDLQVELSRLGLNVRLERLMPESGWLGEIDNLPFKMTISSRDEDGFRNFMLLFLNGQEEERTILIFSKLMGYDPFCRYLYEKSSETFVVYEWEKKDPAFRFEKLKDRIDVYKLQKFEKGFQSPQPYDVKRFFWQFTPETAQEWEGIIQKDPNAEINHCRISDLLPFAEKTMPRISQSQGLFGLSLISLSAKFKNEGMIIQYGLDPLLETGILTEFEEINQIIGLYSRPLIDSPKVLNEFEIDGIKYRLVTDFSRYYRDLKLQVAD